MALIFCAFLGLVRVCGAGLILGLILALCLILCLCLCLCLIRVCGAGGLGLGFFISAVVCFFNIVFMDILK